MTTYRAILLGGLCLGMLAPQALAQEAAKETPPWAAEATMNPDYKPAEDSAPPASEDQVPAAAAPVTAAEPETPKEVPPWAAEATMNPEYEAAKKAYSQNLPSNHYLKNASGQFIDSQGNVTGGKHWSPAAPVDSFKNDGLTQRFYMQSLLSSLTRPLNFINDNGEVVPLHLQSAMAQVPAVVADKNSSGLDWSSYLGNRKKRVCTAYRDQFMTLSGLSSTKYSEYQICGEPDYTHKYSETRFIQTPINGTYYSTPDFYVRYANNWRVWQSAWHGWQWIVPASASAASPGR